MTSKQLPLFLLITTGAAVANDVQELEDVIIAAPSQASFSDNAYSINILSGDELTQKQAGTLGETLKQELGIHSMSFGNNVGQPIIRGQMGNRVQVLQNGLSSLDVSGISPDHANSTEALLAERIEVLRGPSGLLYSSGAIGGIINVIDNRIPLALPDSLKTALEQRYQSVSNQWSSVVKHDGGLNKLAWHVDGFFRSSDNYHVPGKSNGLGYVENSDAQSWSATLGASWVDDWGMLGFSVNHLNNNYGIPPVDELVRIDLQQTRYDAKAEFYDPFTGIEALKFRFSYNDYRHNELEDGITIGTQFDNQGIEGRFELAHKAFSFIDHGTIGLQVQNKKLHVVGTEAYIPPSATQNYATFLVESISTDKITYELGLRIEHQQIDAEGFARKHHTPINASLSALWQPNDAVLMSLAFTHAQRAPNVQELFADGIHFAAQSYVLGNENLQLETSYNLELSFKTHFHWLSTELNLFHNWSNQYINQQNTGTWFNLDNEQITNRCPTGTNCLPVYQAMQDNVRFYGFEAQINMPLWEAMNHQFDISVFSDYVRGKFNAGGNVPRMPPLRYGMQLNYTAYDALTANLRLTRAGTQKHTGKNESTTPGYLLLNLNANYKVDIMKTAETLLFFKATNLLNATIRNASSFLKDVAPEPGRGVEIGVRIRF